MSKRVFVGLSGGVDSSVAAKRLIEAGYEVAGVFIKVWQPDFIHCDWEKERLDAMRVAAHLGIPFLTMDAVDAYKAHVADYMIQSYKEGLTPNPDVMCNEHVKFGAFYEWAKANGAQYVATGHYARVDHTTDISQLRTGIDSDKDQSYFLWRIPARVLRDVLFPIGDTRKPDVRNEARRAGIPTATKADSQGICFLGEVDMRTFLSEYLTLTKGAVLNTKGEIIGSHHGAVMYTIGQRHGFEVTGSALQVPHYVVSRDIEANTITVDTNPGFVSTATLELTLTNELGSGFAQSMDAVCRYHGTREPVELTEQTADHLTLRLTGAPSLIKASGQSCVLYRGDECVGGGVIRA
jgi:tRNA-uridine 2-sulfurtransferase